MTHLLIPAIRDRLVDGGIVGRLADHPPPPQPDALLSVQVEPGEPTVTRFGGTVSAPAAAAVWWRSWNLVFQQREARGHMIQALQQLQSVTADLVRIRGPEDIGDINAIVHMRFARVLTEPHWIRQDELERPICQASVRVEAYA